ncbi:MAG: hypothetical protein JWO91_1674 [Acidobacteriaceae bacterium]|nr:hypothetical protein [Acidobacteriaceae bacterium]
MKAVEMTSGWPKNKKEPNYFLHLPTIWKLLAIKSLCRY